jgi:hypothetical protein
MRGFLKIVLLCIFLFSVSVFIAKKSIDHTFKKTSYTQIVNTSAVKIIDQVKEV